VHRVDCGIVASYDLDGYASIDGDVITAKTQRRTLPWKYKENKSMNRKKKRRKLMKKKLK
jgi:hypothetical protein